MLSQEEADSSTAALPYNMEEWEQGYRSQPHEYDYWIDEVEGQIPAELTGTLFRNGPALFDVNGQRIHHPFDGDGMVCAIAFNEGRAHFRNRLVRTTAFEDERAAGKILYRGVFGTEKAGGWLANAFDIKLKNIANTNVIYWGDRLLALWEAAEPYRLDPYTLETIGKDDFYGLLPPGKPFGAHPKIDRSRDKDNPTLVNFALEVGLPFKIAIYETDLRGTLKRRYTHNYCGFLFIHDFVVTPNYCLLFNNPLDFNPLPFLFGFKGPGQCIKFRPDRPTEVLVIPRDPAKPMLKIKGKSGFIYHHANAFEEGDEICVDSICYESFFILEPGEDFLKVDFPKMDPGQLWRFRINLKTQTMGRELLESRCCEFPVINPQKVAQPHRYVFLGAADIPEGNTPLQAILKLDLETGDRHLWSAAPHGFNGEPIFVPRPNATQEDDGWVFNLVYDGVNNRSDLVILDGRDLSLLARLHLKHHIPYGLHGCWTNECFLP
ncbi:MAG: carotenoid oxygenase family protein [Cyanosarcina radialis HA8281-LM2]|jgi:all-trans-8'-apo-beta-carotenal 15,15'-oxygenase|nr:carotenoid oxygenase family protein [Cyanosarcina radialis HA8281-LM2]